MGGHQEVNSSRSATSVVVLQQQVLAQLKLKANAENYGKTVTMLRKELDEEVARLNVDRLGVTLTKLSKEQADYLGVPVEGPYEAEHYR